MDKLPTRGCTEGVAMGSNLPTDEVRNQIDNLAESIRDAYRILGALCDALGLPKPPPM